MSKQQVIVLNASYEPLGVVPIRKALLYVIKERAEVVKTSSGETVRTSSGELEIPIAVRFTKMVKVPYLNKEKQWSRRAVLDRDGHKCAYCAKPATTIDHVQPRSRGGENSFLNCVASCVKCNSKKSDKTPSEAGMPLLIVPRVVYRQESLIAAIAATGFDMDTLFAV